MHYPTLCLCSPQTGSSSFRNYFDSLSWNALSKVQSVVTCIFYCWCEVICPGIEFTAVIWTQVFSKPQGDTQSWSGTEWLQENKTELSRYPVWGIKMPLLVTVCLLPGGINKGTFFSGQIVELALLSWDLPKLIPCQIKSFHISLWTKVPWKIVAVRFTLLVFLFLFSRGTCDYSKQPKENEKQLTHVCTFTQGHICLFLMYSDRNNIEAMVIDGNIWSGHRSWCIKTIVCIFSVQWENMSHGGCGISNLRSHSQNRISNRHVLSGSKLNLFDSKVLTYSVLSQIRDSLLHLLLVNCTFCYPIRLMRGRQN